MNKRRIFLTGLLFFATCGTLYAAGPPSGQHEANLIHSMSVLVLQIGIILFAGYLGAVAARRVGEPVIIGELLMGIVIGPHLLGALRLPLFPHGLFPVADNSLAISPELYGFATVASIVLLFLTGLQTDLRLFLRFAFKGSLVGLGGGLLSLSAGIITGYLFLNNSLFDPRNIFLGVVAIATSIDISARILSERRKMASAEGVTILAASVIEDVMGIAILAVIVGLDTASHGTAAGWRHLLVTAGKAFSVWLGFTIVGILASHQISAALKIVKNPSQIAVLALGLALLVSGLFETAGIAMIIGAYVCGLALANTDISYVIQEKIEPIHHFFDPIFFVVIGMIVNLHVMLSWDVARFGLLFAGLAWTSKFIGCSLPSLACGFTRHGAYRIALGMIPRGEVALIIASIGLSAGILDERLFGIIIFMTLATTLTAPRLLSRALLSRRPSTTRTFCGEETEITSFDLGSPELTSFLLADVVQAMRGEGFFVTASDGERKLYQMRKGLLFITMQAGKDALHFTSRPDDITLINNLMYESILTLQQKVNHIKTFAKPLELQKKLVAVRNRTLVDWYRYLSPECITLDLQSQDKESAIRELVGLLAQAGKLSDIQKVVEEVLEREQVMSTGMHHGIALPHGRSTVIRELAVAVGISHQGVEFQSLDEEPARLIFMVVSPQDNSGPHLQILAGIAGILNREEARRDILSMTSRHQLIEYMVNNSNAK